MTELKAISEACVFCGVGHNANRDTFANDFSTTLIKLATILYVLEYLNNFPTISDSVLEATLVGQTCFHRHKHSPHIR